MAFTAQCPYCHVKVRNVPEERSGASSDCPRCHNPFTLVAQVGVRASSNSASSGHSAAKSRSAENLARQASLSVSSASPTAPETSWPTAPLPIPPPKQTAHVDEDSDANAFGNGSRRTRAWSSWLGVFAFLLGSVALLAASVGPLELVTLPASGLGVILGIAGFCVRSKRRCSPVWPTTGLAVSLTICVIAGIAPTLLGLAPRGTATTLSVSDQLTLVPLADRHGKSAHPAADEEWADASRQAVHKKDLRLAVISAAVKPLEYKDQKGNLVATRERYLLIALRLSNVGINHTISYESWAESGHAAIAARLRDDRDASYASKAIESDRVVAGHVVRATIGPLKAVHDLLVFEVPTAGFESLRLELPCAAFGVEGKFQLVIPKRFVTYR